MTSCTFAGHREVYQPMMDAKINDDICATAKGYELLAEQKLHRKGGIV